MSTQSDIQSAFMARLTSFLDVPPIADENEDFIPPAPPAAWLRTSMLRVPATVAELGDIGRNMQKGIFQISVFGPKNTSRSATLALADALVEWFKRGTVLASGSVSDIKVRISSVGKQVPDPDWFMLPVSIEYFTLTDN